MKKLLIISILFGYLISYSQVLKVDKLNFKIDLRSRGEYWNTFLKSDSGTQRYFFILSRARVFAEFSRKSISMQFAFQGLKALFLPESAVDGAGKVYFDNNKERAPDKFSILLLNLSGKLGNFYFKLGRVSIEDGAEVFHGEQKFDMLKKTRISERLVGSWDWTNAGRRYDGLICGYNGKKFNANLFAARVLGGGIDFKNTGKWLDISIAGASLTFSIPGSDLRIFDIFYQDERDEVLKKLNLSEKIKLHTLGLSAIKLFDHDNSQIDIVGYTAFQFGNFGQFTQRAYAFIGEFGYQIKSTSSPWLRFGIAYASGDENKLDNTRKTFFNLTPTNHKWYGNLDMFSFSNLLNLYIQFMINYKFLNLNSEFHIFKLANGNDDWIAGSGAFNNSSLGYSALAVSPGRTDLGKEFDFVSTFKFLKNILFEIGYSYFWGSDVVKNVFVRKPNKNWLYFQFMFQFL